MISIIFMVSGAQMSGFVSHIVICGLGFLLALLFDAERRALSVRHLRHSAPPSGLRYTPYSERAGPLLQ